MAQVSLHSDKWSVLGGSTIYFKSYHFQNSKYDTQFTVSFLVIGLIYVKLFKYYQFTVDIFILFILIFFKCVRRKPAKGNPVSF